MKRRLKTIKNYLGILSKRYPVIALSAGSIVGTIGLVASILTICDVFDLKCYERFFEKPDTTISEILIYDLRKIKHIPKDKKTTEKISRTILLNILERVKNSDKKICRLPYAGDGAGVDINPISHKAISIVDGEPHTHRGRLFKPKAAILDISNIERGRPCFVVNEVTFWNQFSNKEELVATWVDEKQTDTARIVFIIFFPNHLPFTSYKIMHYSSSDHELRPLRLAQSEYIDNSSPKSNFLHIVIPKGRPSFVYEVRWTWDIAKLEQTGIPGEPDLIPLK